MSKRKFLYDIYTHAKEHTSTKYMSYLVCFLAQVFMNITRGRFYRIPPHCLSFSMDFQRTFPSVHHRHYFQH